MNQLYFLSVLLNGLTGYFLLTPDRKENETMENSLKFSFSGGGFRLIMGIFTAVIGLLKLLVPMRWEGGPSIPVLGDLLPAVGGLAAGFILIFSFYRENSVSLENTGNLDRIGDVFLQYKKAAGITLLVVALLHFLFPQAVLL